MNPIILFGAGLIVARILASARRGSSASTSKPPAKGPRTPSPDSGAAPVRGRATPADLAAYYRMSPGQRLAAPPVPGSELFTKARYEPFSRDAIALFTEAARLLGPEYDGWGSARGIHFVMGEESSGYVGIPNSAPRPYNPADWRNVWAQARALNPNANPYGTEYIGLGQLGPDSEGWGVWGTAHGSVRHMPRGPASYGVALEEAIGMLRYVKDRYGTPEVLDQWYRLPYAPGCGSYRDESGRWVPANREQCAAYRQRLRDEYGALNARNAIRAGFRYHDGY